MPNDLSAIFPVTSATSTQPSPIATPAIPDSEAVKRFQTAMNQAPNLASGSSESNQPTDLGRLAPDCIFSGNISSAFDSSFAEEKNSLPSPAANLAREAQIIPENHCSAATDIKSGAQASASQTGVFARITYTHETAAASAQCPAPDIPAAAPEAQDHAGISRTDDAPRPSMVPRFQPVVSESGRTAEPSRAVAPAISSLPPQGQQYTASACNTEAYAELPSIPQSRPVPPESPRTADAAAQATAVNPHVVSPNRPATPETVRSFEAPQTVATANPAVTIPQPQPISAEAIKTEIPQAPSPAPQSQPATPESAAVAEGSPAYVSAKLPTASPDSQITIGATDNSAAAVSQKNVAEGASVSPLDRQVDDKVPEKVVSPEPSIPQPARPAAHNITRTAISARPQANPEIARVSLTSEDDIQVSDAALQTLAASFIQPSQVQQAAVFSPSLATEAVNASQMTSAAASARTHEITEAAEAVCHAVLVSHGISRDEGEIRLQLKPDVLDGSEIRLEIKNQQLSVVFHPVTANAGLLIEQNLPRLEQHLAQHIHAYQITLAIKKDKSANERT